MMAGRLNDRPRGRGRRTGSALILTVVLTTLLALIGVLFIMAARIDKMGTTATSESRELDFAVDTVVAQICEVLAEDVPGASDSQEYYDYPDANNVWLAELEPTRGTGGGYEWRQITNLTGVVSADTKNVTITVAGEHDAISDVNSLGSNADADGDGVSDARWYAIPAVMSGRGKPIYAAVRIVDNGGMLNINSGYWLDPSPLTPRSWVDGSSLSHVNAVALAKSDAASLLAARGITDAVNGPGSYEHWAIWGYLRPRPADPNYPYTPFDLSDELELRYRFIVNHTGVDTRAEAWGRFRDNTISTPVDSGGAELSDWFNRAADPFDPNYAYRHIATTYNMDRIITPGSIQAASRPRNPWKMVNVNDRPPDVVALREAIAQALMERNPNAQAAAIAAAQMTANLIDYIDDDDDDVTAVAGPESPVEWYYGFERPCTYISEIAYRFVPDPEDPNVIHKSYAIELYKPYFEDNNPKALDWQLVITSPSGDREVEPIRWSGTRRFHVMLLEDSAAELFNDSDFSDPDAATDTTPYDRSLYADPLAQNMQSTFEEGDTVSLERWCAQTQAWVPDVDSVELPGGWMAMDPNGSSRSIQRDISPHTCIRRLWAAPTDSPTLGSPTVSDPAASPPEEIIQAHPANRPLTNVGELGMVFAKSAYDDSAVKDAVAAQVLFDLANPQYAPVFNYLTVMDPNNHGWSSSETRVVGRVNVNTAPSFVLGQLPWMQYADDVAYEKARAIVSDRDINGPYRSTADLMRVEALHKLAFDNPDRNWYGDPSPGPDLDPVADTALDDFEERDLLFQRISNLVTVRSDVFTAYILVRIGLDGPQRRVMAILDRSAVTAEGGQVRIRALHPVPNPR